MSPSPKIKYCSGYKYQLEENYSIQTPLRPATQINAEYISLDTDGMLSIRSSYAWDGPSGPTVDSPSSMRGSLVHDALYQLIREGFLPMEARETADNMLEQLCIEDGMWRWRAKAWRWAVSTFAKNAAEWKNEHKIVTAP